MSADLYLIRLFWNGFKGCAKKWGRTKELTEAPRICGLRLIAIDFAPETLTAELQEYAEGRREMRPEEIMAANELLDDLRRDSP